MQTPQLENYYVPPADVAVHIGNAPPVQVTVGGKVYRTINGKVFRVEGSSLVPITDQQELLALDKQMNSGGGDMSQTYLIAGGIGLIALLFLMRK